LRLSPDTLVNDVLLQISEFCCIHSSSLQIRNGAESLNDVEKKLSEYTIEDTSNFLVLRNHDVLLEGRSTHVPCDNDDNDSKESQTINLEELDAAMDLPSIKSPGLPTVPNNSFVTETPSSAQASNTNGLYSALEALSTAPSAKELNSLSPSKKQ